MARLNCVTVLAPAKLNLALDVVGLLPGGYHDLDMTMQAITLYERVVLRRSPYLNLRLPGSLVAPNDKNTAIKAALAFFDYTGLLAGVDITIYKNTPVRAGMAGGSADAAAVLVGMNELYGAHLSMSELCALGAKIGADVPFALMGGTCRVQGVGDFLKALPPVVLILVMMIASLIAGAAWGFLPGFFKARWNTNETLFTLMMNYVATSIVACMTNIMRGQASSLGTLNKATKAGWFPVIMGQRYTINIIVVIVLTFVMYAYLRFSKQGYEISVVGESENTARYAGINVRRVTVRTMLISGAICGLCGFLIVAGKDQTISTASANGRGFTAIIVAWLAKFNTFYMALISFLLVFLERGASEIASAYSLNEYAADIITGIILFFILGSEFFINYRVIPRGAHNEGK